MNIEKVAALNCLVRARRGARLHLIRPLGYNTLCGVNHVAMTPIYSGGLIPPGHADWGLEQRDRILKYATCQDCLAALPAILLRMEEA